jgi:hypothetical protein
VLPLLDWVHHELVSPVAAEARAVDHAPDPAVVALVAGLLKEDRLSAADWAAVAARLWMRCGPAPLVEAPASFWRDVFTRGAYARNGHRDYARVASIVLWRGASQEWQRGWAWADQRRVAELHASSRAAAVRSGTQMARPPRQRPLVDVSAGQGPFLAGGRYWV